MPFAAVGADEGAVWLGEGIAEDIMTELSRFTDLGIIARNSSFHYPTDVDGPQEVGSMLGADYLLQDSVRHLGERIRVAIQLVDTETGGNVWAERYDQPFNDVDALAGEMVGSIAARLAASVHRDTASAASVQEATRTPI